MINTYPTKERDKEDYYNYFRLNIYGNVYWNSNGTSKGALLGKGSPERLNVVTPMDKPPGLDNENRPTAEYFNDANSNYYKTKSENNFFVKYFGENYFDDYFAETKMSLLLR